MSIGKNLKSARLYVGFTQKKLAEKSGLAEITIRQYELGKRMPGVMQFGKIANALNLGYSFLKNGEPYFYDFVDTVEPVDSKASLFNAEQLKEANESQSDQSKD